MLCGFVANQRSGPFVHILMFCVLYNNILCSSCNINSIIIIQYYMHAILNTASTYVAHNTVPCPILVLHVYHMYTTCTCIYACMYVCLLCTQVLLYSYMCVCVCAAKTKALFTAACVCVCEQQRSMDRYMIAMDTTIRGTTRWGQVCI